MPFKSHSARLALIFLAAFSAAPNVHAAELAIIVTGIEQADGQIGCALYSKSDAFLKPSSKIKRQWVKAESGAAQCHFNGLKAGAYAVAVIHDMNGNKTNDVNLFGIPMEPWGVSNNARPMFRAPTFEEAEISVEDGKPLEISVEIETTIP